MSTGSLVPSRRILAGVLAALSLALAWQLGERRGRERAEATGERGVLASGESSGPDERPVESIGDLPLEARRGADALAALRGERDMLRETVRSLRVELGRADRLAVDERAELELYRRIGADETRVGLAIDALERRIGNPATDTPATLRVTLVQARGRDRIEGEIGIVPLDENAGRLPPEESSREVRAALAAGPPATWSVPFDLRFFETLEIPLGERFPRVVEIRVVPAAKSRAPFRVRVRRDAIRILD